MFEPYYLFLSIFLGLVGFAAFRYGKRESSIRHMVLAVSLMVVPYFLTDAKLLALAGAALVVLLFFP